MMEWSILTWSLIVAIVIPPLFLILFQRFSKKLGKSSTLDVIMCGPAGSGKTTLFLRLVSSPLKAVSSATINVSAVDNGVTLKDVPGSAKLRDALFKDVMNGRVRKIILIIDGSNPTDNLHQDIPFIINVLSMATSHNLPILLLASKMDLNHSALNATISTINDELKRVTRQFSIDGEDETDIESQLRIDIMRLLSRANLEDEPESISLSTLNIDIQSHAYSINDQQSLETVQSWITK